MRAGERRKREAQAIDTRMTSARYSGEYGERTLGIANAMMAVYPSARTMPTAAEKYVSQTRKRPRPSAAMEMSTGAMSVVEFDLVKAD